MDRGASRPVSPFVVIGFVPLALVHFMSFDEELELEYWIESLIILSLAHHAKSTVAVVICFGSSGRATGA